MCIATKPPIGVESESVWWIKRVDALVSALHRYCVETGYAYDMDGITPNPALRWAEELVRRLRELEDSCIPGAKSKE